MAHDGLVRSLAALGRTDEALCAAEDGRALALARQLGGSEAQAAWSVERTRDLAAGLGADLVYYQHNRRDKGDKLYTWVVPRSGEAKICFAERDVEAEDVPEVAAATRMIWISSWRTWTKQCKSVALTVLTVTMPISRCVIWMPCCPRKNGAGDCERAQARTNLHFLEPTEYI